MCVYETRQYNQMAQVQVDVAILNRLRAVAACLARICLLYQSCPAVHYDSDVLFKGFLVRVEQKAGMDSDNTLVVVMLGLAAAVELADNVSVSTCDNTLSFYGDLARTPFGNL